MSETGFPVSFSFPDYEPLWTRIVELVDAEEHGLRDREIADRLNIPLEYLVPHLNHLYRNGRLSNSGAPDIHLISRRQQDEWNRKWDAMTQEDRDAYLGVSTKPPPPRPWWKRLWERVF